MNRRNFIKTSAAAAAAMHMPLDLSAATGGFSFKCFTKLLQWLDYAETAEVLKQAGFDGADLTVRPGGHVVPERVEEDLPRAVEALKKVGLTAPMMVTKITAADEPYAEKTLRTARALGIKNYRMGYLSYDTSLGIAKSIENLRPQMKELADLNRQIGVTGGYQNHAGTRIGSSVWDLFLLLKDIDPKYLGIQYDIKHATAEGGHSWKVGLELVAGQVMSLVLKDFLWTKQDNGAWKDATVPLGTGMVDYAAFFKEIKMLGISCPITVHFEYKMPHELLQGSPHDVVKNKEIAVYKRDLSTAKELMHKAGLI